MLRILVMSFLILLLFACKSTESSNILLGDVSAETVLNYTEFNQQFHIVEFSDAQINRIKHWPKGLKLTIYFGTWCHDSQREVPKLLKILTYNPEIAHQLIALDYSKQEPQHRAEMNQVRFTPTVIVFFNGQEIGRVIEWPKQDWVTEISNALATIKT